MATVSYQGATRIYPGNPPVRAVDHLDIDIADGEFLVLVGPSGSGKSTALRMLAGLEDVDEGSISIDDRDITNVQPKDRDIAMVFQSYALYPHMTVAENMGFALKLRKVGKAETVRRVREAAELLDLTRYLDRKPKALSGGQRQRVAMGRAIVREPAVFLMDEPLSNLDAKLRVETRANIAALQKRLGATTVYVTHDQVEAMTMGHRVAVLKDGLLQQVDTPRGLYERPANAFVAGFIGSPSMNLLTVDLVAEGAQLDGLTVALPRTTMNAAHEEGLGTVTLGIRPESFHLAHADEKSTKLTVELVEELGADAYVHGTIQVAGKPQRLVVRTDGRKPPTIGQTVNIAPPAPQEIHAFSTATDTRLPD